MLLNLMGPGNSLLCRMPLPELRSSMHSVVGRPLNKVMNPRFSTTASGPNTQHPKIGKLGQERYTCVGYACVPPPLPASGRRPAVAQYYSPALDKKKPSCDPIQAGRLRSRERSGLLLSGWERRWLCTRESGPAVQRVSNMHSHITLEPSLPGSCGLVSA